MILDVQHFFSKNNELIVSTDDGVFILNGDNTTSPIYHTDKFDIKYCNDMKVGPDGRIYVGTQSSKRKGVSDKTDGKLYSIDKNGNVCVLLDNLILSNGLEWSMRTVSLSKLFIVKFAEPLFACIFGAVLLGENIFKIQYLLAFVLISTGIIMGNKDQ